MRYFLLIIYVILIAYPGQSFSNSLHCEGKTEWGDMDIQVNFYIKLPEKIDSVISIPTSSGENQALLVGRGERKYKSFMMVSLLKKGFMISILLVWIQELSRG